MIAPQGQRIVRLILNVRDLERMSAFYVGALGFSRIREQPGAVGLRLGAQEIELVRQPPQAPPYPTPRSANDPWFQHFAIVVADMTAAYAQLSRHDPIPISRGGPQHLPPSTGSVTAYKFRDPEGRPLELSYIPGSAWLAQRPRDPAAVFLGVDHTALACADLQASIAFYTAAGFAEGPRFLNTGPEQDRLDGLEGVVLDIATLMAPGGGPHIELLHYRAPAASPTQPIDAQGSAATRIVLAERPSPPHSGVIDHDPDGHRLAYDV